MDKEVEFFAKQITEVVRDSSIHGSDKELSLFSKENKALLWDHLLNKKERERFAEALIQKTVDRTVGEILKMLELKIFKLIFINEAGDRFPVENELLVDIRKRYYDFWISKYSKQLNNDEENLSV